MPLKPESANPRATPPEVARHAAKLGLTVSVVLYGTKAVWLVRQGNRVRGSYVPGTGSVSVSGGGVKVVRHWWAALAAFCSQRGRVR